MQYTTGHRAGISRERGPKTRTTSCCNTRTSSPLRPARSLLTTLVSYTAQGHTSKESNSQWTKDYGYSAAERLIHYSQTDTGQSTSKIEASYRYNPFGRRISKTIKQGGTTKTVHYFYSEQGLMAEMDEAAKFTKAYGFNPIAAQQGLWSTDPI